MLNNNKSLFLILEPVKINFKFKLINNKLTVVKTSDNRTIKILEEKVEKKVDTTKVENKKKIQLSDKINMQDQQLDTIPKIKNDTITKKSVFDPFANPIINYSEISNNNKFVEKEISKNFAFANSWVLGLIITISLLFIWIRYLSKDIISKLFTSSVSHYASQMFFKKKSIKNVQASFLLNVLFFANISFFLYQVLSYNNARILNLTTYKLFGFILLLTLAFYFIKSFLYIFSGIILNTIKESFDYILNIFLYKKIIGVIFIPLIISIPYVNTELVKPLIYLGFLIFLILYLLQIFRGIQILFKKRISILYMFLYLCALEILPVIIIYKYYLLNY